MIDMSRRSNLFFTVTAAVIAFAALLALVANGAGKATNAITAQSIGYVDLASLQQDFPDFVRLRELKTSYEKELNSFANGQQQIHSAYVQELEAKKAKEMEGKTEAEKKNIEAKYEQLARTKATEIRQSFQAKSRELQSKLDVASKEAEQRLRQTISAVGDDKGMNLILVKTAIYYGGRDLTQDVLAKAGKK